jgi:hypothetical protein
MDAPARSSPSAARSHTLRRPRKNHAGRNGYVSPLHRRAAVAVAVVFRLPSNPGPGSRRTFILCSRLICRANITTRIPHGLRLSVMGWRKRLVPFAVVRVACCCRLLRLYQYIELYVFLPDNTPAKKNYDPGNPQPNNDDPSTARSCCCSSSSHVASAEILS